MLKQIKYCCICTNHGFVYIARYSVCVAFILCQNNDKNVTDKSRYQYVEVWEIKHKTLLCSFHVIPTLWLLARHTQQWRALESQKFTKGRKVDPLGNINVYVSGPNVIDLTFYQCFVACMVRHVYAFDVHFDWEHNSSKFKEQIDSFRK